MRCQRCWVGGLGCFIRCHRLPLLEPSCVVTVHAGVLIMSFDLTAMQPSWGVIRVCPIARMYASVTVLGRFHSLPPCHTGCCHSCHQVSHATDAAPRCQIGCQRRPSTCLTCTRVCHACIAMQLNERVLSSSSSYPLRVLHTSFAAGSKIDLHHNFTKKTYERDGVLRLMCVPDHALLASRRDALFFPERRPATQSGAGPMLQ